MKKISGILMLMGLIVSTSQAQKISKGKLPRTVRSAFKKVHPKTNAKWALEKQNYEAGFTLNGRETSEVYSRVGSLLETEVSIKTTELPETVLAKLKGMKIAEAAKITKANGTVNYEAEVKGKDLLFDADGNPLKP